MYLHHFQKENIYCLGWHTCGQWYPSGPIPTCNRALLHRLLQKHRISKESEQNQDNRQHIFRLLCNAISRKVPSRLIVSHNQWKQAMLHNWNNAQGNKSTTDYWSNWRRYLKKECMGANTLVAYTASIMPTQRDCKRLMAWPFWEYESTLQTVWLVKRWREQGRCLFHFLICALSARCENRTIAYFFYSAACWHKK